MIKNLDSISARCLILILKLEFLALELIANVALPKPMLGGCLFNQ